MFLTFLCLIDVGMAMKEWEEHLRHLREKKLSREEQLRKIHRHKSVFKKALSEK